MTEPAVASSDARNVECRIEADGNDYVINGRKWWSSGMGDPQCAVVILMGKSDPNAPAYRQQSMIVVPRDAKGIKIVKMLHVFGYDDAPHGHAEVVYDNCRVLPEIGDPAGQVCRGFEIAQGRLGLNRHPSLHARDRRCRAGAPDGDQARQEPRGVRPEDLGDGCRKAHVADMRMEIDMARLLVLKAAWAMDKFGNKEARQQIGMIRVAGAPAAPPREDRRKPLPAAPWCRRRRPGVQARHAPTSAPCGLPTVPTRSIAAVVGRLEIAKHN